MIETKTRSFKSDFCVAIPQFMYIRILDEEIADLVAVFNNSVETETITFNGTEYKGYSKFVAISVEGDAYKICLERI